METVEEARLKEPEPISEGRAAPSREDEARQEEDREKLVKHEIEQAQSDVDAAVMLAPHDEDVQRLQNELRGAGSDPKAVDLNKLRQTAREAKEKASEKTQQAVMGGMAALVGIGAAMAAMGIVTDGKHYHPAQTGTGELPNNIAGLPTRERSGEQLAI